MRTKQRRNTNAARKRRIGKAISYTAFCTRIGPTAPAFVDALDKGERERLLKVAWKSCARSARLTDARIIEAFRDAIFTLAENNESLWANVEAAPLLDRFLLGREFVFERDPRLSLLSLLFSRGQPNQRDHHRNRVNPKRP